ncbi:MAG: PQQ-like beta-propeller repeat protein [Candidatus Eremiobacteraeota bacterium]|nr:PQQ-like beta-propeller repeat protein [Candidatus Eremiobacteraeota bacterium]
MEIRPSEIRTPQSVRIEQAARPDLQDSPPEAPAQGCLNDRLAPSPPPPMDLARASALISETTGKMEELWREKPSKWIDNITINDEGTLFAEGAGETCLISADGSAKGKISGYSGCVNGLAPGPGNTLFVATNQGDPDGIFAFDGTTGREKWHRDAKGDTFFGGVTPSPDGTLFASITPYQGSSAEDRLVALDGGSGETAWQFRAGGRIQGKPLLGPENTVILGSHDHKLYSLDRKTGKKRWDFDSGGPIACGIIHGPDGTIIGITREGSLFAVDGVSGAGKWAVPTGEKGYTSGAPACSADGTVFVITPDTEGVLKAFDGRTGALRWEDRREKWVKASLVADGEGTLYVGCKDSEKVILYDGATGRVKEEIKVGEQVDALAYDDERKVLYCGTSDGSVIAFSRPGAGEPAENVTAEAPGNGRPELQDEEDFIVIDSLRLPKKKQGL